MRVDEINIRDVVVSENIRVDVKDRELVELMSSIKQHGLQQAIGVAKLPQGKYRLVFGHRRLTACSKLGWIKIPAVISESVDDVEFYLVNATENLQRKDISPMELGRVCENLKALKLTEAEIAMRLSVSVARVLEALAIYHGLPAKHRENVKYMSKGEGKKPGNIAASTARMVINIKKTYGLSAYACDKLLTEVAVKGLSNMDIKVIASLLNNGLSLAEATEKANSYIVIRVDVPVLKKELVGAMDKAKVSSTNEFIARICYGDFKPLSKPVFFNEGRRGMKESLRKEIK